MNALDTADLRDLVGVWTLLTLGVGLIGVIVSYAFRKAGGSTRRQVDRRRIAEILSAKMFLLALFIALLVLPASMSYSGPVPAEVRETWRYDKYLAALIAAVFSVVFAFDARRLRGDRRQ